MITHVRRLWRVTPGKRVVWRSTLPFGDESIQSKVVMARWFEAAEYTEVLAIEVESEDENPLVTYAKTRPLVPDAVVITGVGDFRWVPDGLDLVEVESNEPVPSLLAQAMERDVVNGRLTTGRLVPASSEVPIVVHDDGPVDQIADGRSAADRLAAGREPYVPVDDYGLRPIGDDFDPDPTYDGPVAAFAEDAHELGCPPGPHMHVEGDVHERAAAEAQAEWEDPKWREELAREINDLPQPGEPTKDLLAESTVKGYWDELIDRARLFGEQSKAGVDAVVNNVVVEQPGVLREPDVGPGITDPGFSCEWEDFGTGFPTLYWHIRTEDGFGANGTAKNERQALRRARRAVRSVRRLGKTLRP